MKRNNSQDESKSRGKPSKATPWCWQEKGILRMITETFSESNQSASARSVYVALCELASDHQSDTFTESKALIAHKAGVSVSTVQRLLNIFEQLGVLHVKRGCVNGVKTANTYTLLPMRHSDLSIGHRLQQGFNPDKDKESEKISEKSDNKSAPTAASSSSLSNLVSDLKDAEKHPHWRQFKAYCRSKNGSPTLKGFNTWLRSQPPPTRRKSSNNGELPAHYREAMRASQDRADRERGLT